MTTERPRPDIAAIKERRNEALPDVGRVQYPMAFTILVDFDIPALIAYVEQVERERDAAKQETKDREEDLRVMSEAGYAAQARCDAARKERDVAVTANIALRDAAAKLVYASATAAPIYEAEAVMLDTLAARDPGRAIRAVVQAAKQYAATVRFLHHETDDDTGVISSVSAVDARRELLLVVDALTRPQVMTGEEE